MSYTPRPSTRAAAAASAAKRRAAKLRGEVRPKRPPTAVDVGADADRTGFVLPRHGYSRVRTIARVFDVSPAAWWRGVSDGKFPQPVKLGAATTVWRNVDLWALIEDPEGWAAACQANDVAAAVAAWLQDYRAQQAA